MEEIKLEELKPALVKMEDTKAEVTDLLVELNLGNSEDNRPVFISQLLGGDERQGIIDILKANEDVFAWDCDEMLGLDRSLVEHKLRSKKSFGLIKGQAGE